MSPQTTQPLTAMSVLVSFSVVLSNPLIKFEIISSGSGLTAIHDDSFDIDIDIDAFDAFVHVWTLGPLIPGELYFGLHVPTDNTTFDGHVSTRIVQCGIIQSTNQI
mmetsp:Transcript_13084/g.17131  ORF Transcript_13084/g.17131 Transcript_13084/m.17131 type:complete len:106 (+) Transcript_13084:44-361(+)